MMWSAAPGTPGGMVGDISPNAMSQHLTAGGSMHMGGVSPSGSIAMGGNPGSMQMHLPMAPSMVASSTMQLPNGPSQHMPMGSSPMAMASSPTYQTRGSPQAQRVPVATRSLMVPGGQQHRPAPIKTGECEEECAEEECDADKCGAENQAPRGENFLGFDTKFVLPGALFVSMAVGAICMAAIEMPMFFQVFELDEVLQIILTVLLMGLYGITMSCIAYCFFCDPGQLTPALQQQALSAAPMDQSNGFESEAPLPKRAHKTWQYARPVRRYDHYCRWVTNSIGLLNHREFVVMCTGIVVVSAVGIIIDVMLGYEIIHLNLWDFRAAIVALHLAYSGTLLCLAGPILRIHIGLVSRNELAAEWKRNDYYVARSKHGDRTPVNELSDDEFNTLFDDFIYEKKRNAWDKGCSRNCWTFWCTPRWRKNQLGEF